MSTLAVISAGVAVLRYYLRLALVVQTLLLWYVDILGRVLQRTLALTKKLLKPVETIKGLIGLYHGFRSGGVVQQGVSVVRFKAREEAAHLLREFHTLPLKLQELELMVLSGIRFLVIAAQGSVSETLPAAANASKLSKWKVFLRSEKAKVRPFATQLSDASRKWMPHANGNNANCEVNTVNSARSHILPSPKISEAYAEEATSAGSLKVLDALIQAPVIDRPNQERVDETRALDGTAWNLLELKGLWVDRKRGRREKEDASDKELIRSVAESNTTHM